MELKLVILSLACLSCLVPPSQGTSLMAAKAAALGAAKGAAVLGAGALAAKGLALKGAVVVGAKVALAKALAGKVGAVAAVKPQLQVLPVPPQQTVVLSPPSLSTIKDRVVGLISSVHAAALSKKAAVSDLLLSLLPTKTIVQPPSVVKVVEVPRYLEVKNVGNPCPPSVAIIGPTMHVH